ncbi:hypothetical protein CYJ28_03065 [Aerococcus sanguinicola]|uniref:Uncharacterized protein n=1 Tax=Aerococcus sanguinicola TaxID=119206 RepID=A0A0X8FBZ0_9LACT|nr:hypothetical protein AWM72_06695 [Aerococcus sanguinicola]OFT95776.1 hypothetical protein HMPREF3090_03850 [Aerococcus sp. HMSC23C02]PKZ23551.1 hypothetical protein CYJ28_03065 [Aerococcus sanguinicola]
MPPQSKFQEFLLILSSIILMVTAVFSGLYILSLQPSLVVRLLVYLMFLIIFLSVGLSIYWFAFRKKS